MNKFQTQDGAIDTDDSLQIRFERVLYLSMKKYFINKFNVRSIEKKFLITNMLVKVFGVIITLSSIKNVSISIYFYAEVH